MLIKYYFELDLLAEQRTENPRVGGSIPPLATIFTEKIGIKRKGPDSIRLGMAQSKSTDRTGNLSSLWICYFLFRFLI